MSSLRIPVSSNDHSQGPADAPVTLVEYGDYQCPYCGQAYLVVKQLQARFGDRLRFVFRNFPLTEAHPQAATAALVAEYAGSHGKFWQAHDALYENQQQLGEGLYVEIMRSLGLDEAGLQAAFQSDALLQRIQSDLDGGLRSGVNGTPGFFINGEMYNVRQSFAELADPIAAALG
jgi:Protein-disulfide isomerase